MSTEDILKGLQEAIAESSEYIMLPVEQAQELLNDIRKCAQLLGEMQSAENYKHNQLVALQEAHSKLLAQRLKDHEIAATINAVRDVAIEFAGTQQLRERIASVLHPILHGIPPSPAVAVHDVVNRVADFVQMQVPISDKNAVIAMAIRAALKYSDYFDDIKSPSPCITEQELQEKNESIRKLLADLRAMRKAVPHKISYERIGANEDENTPHQGYVNGFNDCVEACLAVAPIVAMDDRVTEQDAREIAKSLLRSIYRVENVVAEAAIVDCWITSDSFMALLNELNAKESNNVG